MKKMKRLMVLSLHNERGAALVAVFLVLMVLLTLGLGVMALSMGSAKQATVTDTYEKAYYAAEGGAQQGVEYIRQGVLNVYNNIKNDLKAGITGSNNATEFFNSIHTAIFDEATGKTKFTPILTDSTGAAGVTNLTATITSTGSGDTRTYIISSMATGGSASRTLRGTLTVKFVPVQKTGVSFGDECLISGGQMTAQSCTMAINGNTRATGYDFKSSSTVTQSGTRTVDPASASTLDWKLEYDKRYKPKTAATPSYTASNGTTVTGAMFGWANPLPYPMYIEGASNASYTVQLDINSPNKEVQIASARNLTLSNGSTTGSSSNYIKLYSAGDMTITSSLNYAEIYCGGNLEIKSNNFKNLKINCAGNVKLVSGNFTNIKVFSGGDFQLSSATLSGTTIVYAEESISALGSGSFSGQGIIYTNGSLNPQSLSFNFEGIVACKGPLSFNSGSFSFRGNSSLVDTLEIDPFVTGGVTSTVKPPKNNEIFQSSSLTEP